MSTRLFEYGFLTTTNLKIGSSSMKLGVVL